MTARGWVEFAADLAVAVAFIVAVVLISYTEGLDAGLEAHATVDTICTPTRLGESQSWLAGYAAGVRARVDGG